MPPTGAIQRGASTGTQPVSVDAQPAQAAQGNKANNEGVVVRGTRVPTVNDPPGAKPSKPQPKDGNENFFSNLLSKAGEFFTNPIVQGVLGIAGAIPGIGQIVSGVAAVLWLGVAAMRLFDPSHAAGTQGFARLGTVLPELGTALLFGAGAAFPGASVFGGLTGMAVSYSRERAKQSGSA